MDCDVEADAVIDFSYTDVQMQNDMVIFNNLEQMYMISVDDIKKYDGKINEGILKVIPTAVENRFVVITNQEGLEIKLK